MGHPLSIVRVIRIVIIPNNNIKKIYSPDFNVTVMASAPGFNIPVSLRLVFSFSSSKSASASGSERSVDTCGTTSFSTSGMKNSSGVGINNSKQLSRVLAAIAISGSSSKIKQKHF